MNSELAKEVCGEDGELERMGGVAQANDVHSRQMRILSTQRQSVEESIESLRADVAEQTRNLSMLEDGVQQAKEDVKRAEARTSEDIPRVK